MSHKKIPDNSVSFSRIFSDKKCLAVFFPEDIGLTFQLVKEIIAWTPYFQTLYLILPGFQKELYRVLIDEPKIKVEAVENYRPLDKPDLQLLLSTAGKVRKLTRKNRSKAVMGYGKNVNVRFMPLPENPLDLCRQIAVLLNIPADDKRTAVDLSPKEKLSPQSDPEKQTGRSSTASHSSDPGYTASPDSSHTSSGAGRKTHSPKDRRLPSENSVPLCDYLLDLNFYYNRYRISKTLKTLTPPFSSLFIKTLKPDKKSRRTIVSSADNKVRNTHKLDLLEIIRNCCSAEAVLTDNPSFYEIMPDFQLEKKSMLCQKNTSREEIKRFLKKFSPKQSLS